MGYGSIIQPDILNDVFTRVKLRNQDVGQKKSMPEPYLSTVFPPPDGTLYNCIFTSTSKPYGMNFIKHVPCALNHCRQPEISKLHCKAFC